MATEKPANDDTKSGSGNEQDAAKSVRIGAQYVKDLSFENPGAPGSLTPSQDRPDIDVNIDVTAKRLEKNAYEADLKISASAKLKDKTLFVAEVVYSGVFILENIEDDGEKQAALLVYCPSLLFPFARRIIADVTRDGGFPPLMLEPVDFGLLYQRRQQADAAKEG